MRKICMMVLCLSLTGMLTGCGNGSSSSSRDLNQTTGVKELLAAESNAASQAESAGAEESTAAVQAENAGAEESTAASQGENAGSTQTDSAAATQSESTVSGSSAPASENGGQTGSYDVDLTQLSSTMVYSEVYNMMVEPQKYIGKTVKMTGIYSHYYTETTNKDYFSCIVQDATACCAQGIEFVLTDDYKYPEDYPVDGDMITVAGTFQTYYEGEYLYCTLENAVLL